ncbi:MAG: twin-arginine translocase TatA/TatE family subunit [Nannocystaceae bacterium]|nr:twin-arginine translocase TatA/TatE family subunit [bacterium]
MTFALVGLGIGPLEIGVILIVVLLVFGPSKLPQLGEGVGKMLRGFKKEMKSMEEESGDKAADADNAEPAGEIDVTPKDGDKKPA